MTLPARDALDRSKLVVFVAGPGRGEGIAIALPAPKHGWIFVDGCKVNAGARASLEQTYPLHAIWSRYRLPDEPVEGVVLTHPHDDHYDGMSELIEKSEPRWIGCVATHHPDGGAFAQQLLAKRDDPALADSLALQLALQRVRGLLALIQRKWDDDGSRRRLLRAGDSLPLDREDVTIRIVAPDSAGVQAFFRDPRLDQRIRTRANELSVVLEVRYGAARLVLGADLPELDHGAGPRTGWTKVLADYPDVPGSHFLKVPHHGSDGAQHPQLVGAGVAPESAVWALTPFRGGDNRPVPHLTHGRGVDALLAGIPTTHLSCLPPGWQSTVPIDQVVPIDALRPIAIAPDPDPSATNISLATEACGALDAVWMFVVGDDAQITEKHRGARAVEVGRSS